MMNNASGKIAQFRDDCLKMFDKKFLEDLKKDKHFKKKVENLQKRFNEIDLYENGKRLLKRFKEETFETEEGKIAVTEKLLCCAFAIVDLENEHVHMLLPTDKEKE